MEDFVTFELAKKLRAKGFDEECYTFYEYDSKEFYREERIPCCNSLSDDCAAPTISQVLKWLRDEKKIFIEIQISSQGYWCCIHENVRCEGNKDFRWDNWLKENVINEKKTYELAALAGIKYVIDNLI